MATRWDLRSVKALDSEQLNAMSLDDLKAIDRLLTMTANYRLRYTNEIGYSPARQALERSGIETEGGVKVAEGGRSDVLDHISRLDYFTDLSTSTRRGYIHYEENKRRITQERGIKPSVKEVLDELKRRGIYSQLVKNGQYRSTQDIVESIEQIIEGENLTEVDSVINELIGTAENFYDEFDEGEYGFTWGN